MKNRIYLDFETLLSPTEITTALICYSKNNDLVICDSDLWSLCELVCCALYDNDKELEITLETALCEYNDHAMLFPGISPIYTFGKSNGKYTKNPDFRLCERIYDTVVEYKGEDFLIAQTLLKSNILASFSLVYYSLKEKIFKLEQSANYLTRAFNYLNPSGVLSNYLESRWRKTFNVLPMPNYKEGYLSFNMGDMEDTNPYFEYNFGERHITTKMTPPCFSRLNADFSRLIGISIALESDHNIDISTCNSNFSNWIVSEVASLKKSKEVLPEARLMLETGSEYFFVRDTINIVKGIESFEKFLTLRDLVKEYQRIKKELEVNILLFLLGSIGNVIQIGYTAYKVYKTKRELK